MLDDLEALTDTIYFDDIGKNDGPLPNLYIFRRDKTSTFEGIVYRPTMCLILRGSKEIHRGSDIVTLRRGDAFLVSHDLPVVSKITEASRDAPYLALIFALDLTIIRSLYEQVGDLAWEHGNSGSLTKGSIAPELMEPLSRYLRLHDKPRDAAVLGPLIVREIHYQLLMSPIGGMLRNLLVIDSHASRVAKAILQIREHFREPLIVADIAKIAGMSTSSFHEHFKSVTGTTPLQYQKDLRMIEARELLLAGGRSVSVTSIEVGYESPTHFSRDYARKFGCSPRNDIAAHAELVPA